MVDLTVIFFYFTYLDLAGSLTAIGAAVGKIWLALSGFSFGYLSDNLSPDTRGGRRKVFMWIGAPGLAISFILLFSPHLLFPHTNMFLWLLVWTSMFHIFYGFLLIPYQSWMPEITNEQERVDLSVYQNTANILAAGSGLGFVLFVTGYLENNDGIDGNGAYILVVGVIIIAIIEMGAFLPTLLSIAERKVKNNQKNFVQEFKVVLGNNNYVKWIIIQGIISVGMAIINALTMAYITEILGFSKMIDFISFGVVLFGTTIACFVFWRKLAHRIGKRKTLIVALIWLILILPTTLIIGNNSFLPLKTQGFIFGMNVAGGLSAYYLLPYPILADIADLDERVTGTSRAGFYTGFNFIPLNLFQSVGLLIAGNLIDERLTWFGPVSALFIIITIPILLRANFDPFLTRKKS
jgi:Na+/melibiose symporter-like transporter